MQQRQIFIVFGAVWLFAAPLACSGGVDDGLPGGTHALTSCGWGGVDSYNGIRTLEELMEATSVDGDLDLCGLRGVDALAFDNLYSVDGNLEVLDTAIRVLGLDALETVAGMFLGA